MKPLLDYINEALSGVGHTQDTIEDAPPPMKYKAYMHHNLDRERDRMPQIPSDSVDKFLIHFADKHGIKKSKMLLNKIKPTQNEMNDEKISGMVGDKDFDPTYNVFVVSKDNYLVDGHHRWAAGLESNDEDKTVDVYKINKPIHKVLWILNKMKMTKNMDVNDKKV